jgi:hypothetical protein
VHKVPESMGKSCAQSGGTNCNSAKGWNGNQRKKNGLQMGRTPRRTRLELIMGKMLHTTESLQHGGVAETRCFFFFFSSSSFSSTEQEKKEAPPMTTRLQRDVMNEKRKHKHQKQALSLRKKKLVIFFRSEDSTRRL